MITLEAHQSPAAIASALQLDSHVLTEKPACVRKAQFDQIVDLANARGREVMLAMATRSSPLIKKAQQVIRRGFLGKPYAATMDWVADQTRLQSPAYQASWLSFKQRAGGGKLIFHGIHYLDIIAFLIGQPIRRISAMCANVGGEPIEVEDAAIVNFQTTGGMLGDVEHRLLPGSGKTESDSHLGLARVDPAADAAGTANALEFIPPRRASWNAGVLLSSQPRPVRVVLSRSNRFRSWPGEVANHNRGIVAHPQCGVRWLPIGSPGTNPGARIGHFTCRWGRPRSAGKTRQPVFTRSPRCATGGP